MKYCHRDHLFLERTIKRASRALHLLFVDLHNVKNNILGARREVLLILNIERKTNNKKLASRKGGRGEKKWKSIELKRDVSFSWCFSFSGKFFSSHQFGKRYFSSSAEF